MQLETFASTASSNSGCNIVKDWWIDVVQLICVVEYSGVSREQLFFNWQVDKWDLFVVVARL